MAWWWIVPAFVLGACIGAVIMGVCCANSAEYRKRWWDDE